MTWLVGGVDAPVDEGEAGELAERVGPADADEDFGRRERAGVGWQRPGVGVGGGAVFEGFDGQPLAGTGGTHGRNPVTRGRTTPVGASRDRGSWEKN